jgi:hypothetical protein
MKLERRAEVECCARVGAREHAEEASVATTTHLGTFGEFSLGQPYLAQLQRSLHPLHRRQNEVPATEQHDGQRPQEPPEPARGVRLGPQEPKRVAHDRCRPE